MQDMSPDWHRSRLLERVTGATCLNANTPS